MDNRGSEVLWPVCVARLALPDGSGYGLVTRSIRIVAVWPVPALLVPLYKVAFRSKSYSDSIRLHSFLHSSGRPVDVTRCSSTMAIQAGFSEWDAPCEQGAAQAHTDFCPYRLLAAAWSSRVQVLLAEGEPIVGAPLLVSCRRSRNGVARHSVIESVHLPLALKSAIPDDSPHWPLSWHHAAFWGLMLWRHAWRDPPEGRDHFDRHDLMALGGHLFTIGLRRGSPLGSTQRAPSLGS